MKLNDINYDAPIFNEIGESIVALLCSRRADIEQELIRQDPSLMDKATADLVNQCLRDILTFQIVSITIANKFFMLNLDPEQFDSRQFENYSHLASTLLSWQVRLHELSDNFVAREAPTL